MHLKILALALTSALFGPADLSWAANSLPSSEARAIIQSSLSYIESVDDDEFVEDCCPAWAWKKERLVRLGRVQSQIGDLEGLEQTIQHAKKIGNHRLLAPSQMASLGYSQATAQDRKRAPHTLQDATEIAQLDEYERVRDFALPTVVRAYSIIGETEQAINTSRLIRDVFLRVVALSHAATEEGSLQDISGRLRLVEVALEDASELQDSRDKVNGMIAIGRAQLLNLDVTGGKETLQKALSNAPSIDNSGYQVDSLIQLATAYAEADDSPKGKAIWLTALTQTNQLELKEQPYRLYHLATVSDKVRDIQLLSATLRGLYAKNSLIEDPYERANFMTDLAYRHYEIGERTLARQRLDEANSIAATIPQDGLRPYVLMNLAQSYAKQGDNGRSVAIANVIQEGTLEHRYAFYYIALAQARAGNIGGALTSFHTITKDSHLRAEAAQAITAALSKADETESALTWANSLLSPYERALGLLGIVQGQFEN
jgi:tetratricopeptide (TPR) repeat protein